MKAVPADARPPAPTGDPLRPALGCVTPAETVAALSEPDRRRRVVWLINQAHRILNHALTRHSGNHEITATCLLWSGGRDSNTLAHLMRTRVTHAVHANTGIGIDATREFVRDTGRPLGTAADRKTPATRQHLPRTRPRPRIPRPRPPPQDVPTAQRTLLPRRPHRPDPRPPPPAHRVPRRPPPRRIPTSCHRPIARTHRLHHLGLPTGRVNHAGPQHLPHPAPRRPPQPRHRPTPLLRRMPLRRLRPPRRTRRDPLLVPRHRRPHRPTRHRRHRRGNQRPLPPVGLGRTPPPPPARRPHRTTLRKLRTAQLHHVGQGDLTTPGATSGPCPIIHLIRGERHARLT